MRVRKLGKQIPKGNIMAKYITAIIGSVFMFVVVSLLAGLLFGMVLPRAWWGTVFRLGIVNANIPSFVAITLGGLAARHTFRSSLRGKSKEIQQSQKSERDN